MTFLAQPMVADPLLDKEFREEVIRQGRRPEDPWIGKYVDYEWEKARHFISAFVADPHGKSALEFGCDVGATAIVLALLGFRVQGVDIDSSSIAIAQKNAARYGQTQIAFSQISAGARLPFAPATFDLVACNSVFEYVDPPHLPIALAEIDRVLKHGGVILVLGTSNRLVPREVHSRKWFSNYVPVACDRWFGPRRRGIFPWQVTQNLCGYVDLVASDRGEVYFGVRRVLGDSEGKLRALKLFSLVARAVGLPAGAITPSFFLALEKS